ncbi:hypothetical protein RI367_000186 [Sorochytrium milnesiophthora]
MAPIQLPRLPVPASAVVTADNVARFVDLLSHLRTRMPFRPDNPQHNITTLVKAELRYIIWLKLLTTLHPEQHKDIVPPLDVAYMWIVHLWDIRSYMQDVVRLGGRGMLLWNVPVRRMVELLELGEDIVDSDSEQLWNRFSPAEQYRMPNYDNTHDMQLPFVCPRCEGRMMLPAAEYIALRFGTRTIECETCQRGKINVSLWSTILFLADVRKVLQAAVQDNGCRLKGFQLSSDGDALDDTMSIRLANHWRTDNFEKLLRKQLRQSNRGYWAAIRTALRRSLGLPKFSDDERAHIISSIMHSYGDVVTELSVDLVERAEQWCTLMRTTLDLTDAKSRLAADQDTALTDVCGRYSSFRLLQGQVNVKAVDDYPEQTSTRRVKRLLPCFDILLAYFVHMTQPYSFYRCSLKRYRCLPGIYFASQSSMLRAYYRARRLWRKRFSTSYDPWAAPRFGQHLLQGRRVGALWRLGERIATTPLKLYAHGHSGEIRCETGVRGNVHTPPLVY